ncbi:uncharacterized protein LOC132316672 [Cornus florida]|uniref:uncharacterized protein LOC132316658 n=1 Tax=Cornus florida TaxID=4283 RepID=UPI00289A4BA2|nr:uncharacterized protein LOC132316658 [Cornus florida]XP_059671130.1 uncharacterized protein LOC132316672 [Cornus florida]
MDEMLWVDTSRGIFEVKSFYNFMLERIGHIFPLKAIWRPKAPLKVAFFFWTAAWGSILTVDNLRKRSHVVVNRCCLCKTTGESVNHLLIQCSEARDVWSMLLGAFGLPWVFSKSTVDFLENWKGCTVESRVRDGWRATPLCIWWGVRRERNRRFF